MSNEFSTTATANRKAQANAIPSTIRSVAIFPTSSRGATAGQTVSAARLSSSGLMPNFLGPTAHFVILGRVDPLRLQEGLVPSVCLGNGRFGIAFLNAGLDLLFTICSIERFGRQVIAYRDGESWNFSWKSTSALRRWSRRIETQAQLTIWPNSTCKLSSAHEHLPRGEQATKVMTDNPKTSAYLQEGSPLSCFLPSCRKPFIDTCIHAGDGHYYCSHVCADIGSKIDLSNIEPMKRAKG